MRKAVIAVAIALLAIVGGGGFVFRNELRLLRVFAPEAFGMITAGDGLYVDPAMTAEQTAAVRGLRQSAEDRLREAFQDVITAPSIIACATEECFRSFGGNAQRALSFGDRAILLSPRGLTLPILTHERSHNELYARLWGWRGAFLTVPRWFDEGLAVVVSNEPTHSEAVWNDIERLGLARPALTELIGFGDWGRAVRTYGNGNPQSLKIVYATAGHEVRRWYAKAGPAGLARLIVQIRAGQDFDSAYRAIGG